MIKADTAFDDANQHNSWARQIDTPEFRNKLREIGYAISQSSTYGGYTTTVSVYGFGKDKIKAMIHVLKKKGYRVKYNKKEPSLDIYWDQRPWYRRMLDRVCWIG